MVGHDVVSVGTGRTIIDTKPCTQVMRYHHAGIAVTDIPASKKLYEKLGFQSTITDERIMKNSSGMELHFMQADGPAKDNQNLLMDTPQEKYCGHTHACFAVPSVPAVKEYLQNQGLEITGERELDGKVKAVFIRDLNRTTLEFEKMSGEMETVDDFAGSMIGNFRPIDHVGTRISNPKHRWKWYAEKLGFVHEVMHYENNPEPLKNGRPWIARTETGIDINLLINANMPSHKNKLLEGGLKPGILYAAFEVADLELTTRSLKDAGVPVFNEDEVESFGLKKLKIIKSDRPSVFILDPDQNIYRLLQSST